MPPPIKSHVNAFRGRGRGRSQGQGRGRGSDGGGGRGAGRNPRGGGRVGTKGPLEGLFAHAPCDICHSTFHQKRKCPEAPEAKKTRYTYQGACKPMEGHYEGPDDGRGPGQGQNPMPSA